MSREDVNDASRANPLDVLVSQDQTAVTYDAGRLEFGQTYYWRIDEVNAAPDNTIFKGEIWSFTVEPFAYAIENVIVTTNGITEPDMQLESMVNGSGLDADGRHSTRAEEMWAGTAAGGEPLMVQYEFGKTYKLHEMHVWNYNVIFEAILGFGFKDVTVEYSDNGADWTVLADVEFAQATARADYLANTIVDFGGVAAEAVRLTVNSGWGMMGKFGLSEIHFLYIPVHARHPQPASGAADVSVDVSLSWRAGREAAVHEVYVGADEQAVIDGTALTATVVPPRYDTALDLSQTYYWKIVEVNEAETISSWEGEIWNFSTADFVAVDDFEDYNDDDNRIYETWDDGWVNGTGSTVGYAEAPFAEQTIIHGGRQAMPLFYDNTGGISVSEADLTLAPAQDWTQAGVTTLTVYFYGDLENDAAQVYVKINDTKITGGGNTTMALWNQLNIDLATTGANLQNVTNVTIGVEGSGSGVIYVDDLRLYAAAPAVIEPIDPGADGLVAQYPFENDVSDVTGNGYDGTPAETPFFEDAPGDLGRAMFFDGIDDHVELPIGSLISSLTDMTAATWVNASETGGSWQRVFDFGTSSSAGYMFLSPRTGTSGPARFAITPTAGAGESMVESSAALPTGWHHLAVVIDSANMTLALYVDGASVAEGPTATLPADLGQTTQNWLGRSQYAADAYFTGLIADFSIYSQALSASEVRYLAGDR
jgi:hypothetical protein